MRHVAFVHHQALRVVWFVLPVGAKGFIIEFRRAHRRPLIR